MATKTQKLPRVQLGEVVHTIVDHSRYGRITACGLVTSAFTPWRPINGMPCSRCHDILVEVGDA